MKYLTPAQAVQLVKSGDTIVVQGSTSIPMVLLRALTARAAELRDVKIISGFGVHPEDAPYAKRELIDSFRALNIFVPNNLRRAMKEGVADTIPCFLGEVPSLFRSGLVPVDVAFLNVSEPDVEGFCSFGISADIAFSGAECAKTIIAQVNKYMPRTFGDPVIHVSKITALCRGDEPLVEVPTPVPSEVDTKIGNFIANEIPDGATLQIGVGGIPNAVGKALYSKKHLGVHTELFTTEMMNLTKAGVIDNSLKNINKGKSVTTMILGTRELYDFVDDNVGIEVRDGRYTNDSYVIGSNDNMVSINTTLEVDLTGQCCSESLGSKQFSGSGGQADTAIGAQKSKNGRYFFRKWCCH